MFGYVKAAFNFSGKVTWLYIYMHEDKLNSWHNPKVKPENGEKKKNTRYKFIKSGLTLKYVDNFRWHLMGSDACDTPDCHHSCHPQDN